MNAAAVRGLGRGDVKSVLRDGFLGFILVYPVILTFLARILLPIAAKSLAGRFDLPPYYPLIIGYQFVMLIPIVFGLIVALILLDEKDERTLMALRVTPLPMRSYLLYRLAIPYAAAVAMSIVLILLIGLHDSAVWPLVPVTLVASVAAPMFALLLPAFASNKVEGLAIMKGVGILLVAPIIDWFIHAPWTIALGLFPTYWPVKAYWLAAAGDTGAAFWTHLAVGLIYQAIVLLWLLRVFTRRVLR